MAFCGGFCSERFVREAFAAFSTVLEPGFFNRFEKSSNPCGQQINICASFWMVDCYALHSLFTLLSCITCLCKSYVVTCRSKLNAKLIMQQLDDETSAARISCNDPVLVSGSSEPDTCLDLLALLGLSELPGLLHVSCNMA